MLLASNMKVYIFSSLLLIWLNYTGLLCGQRLKRDLEDSVESVIDRFWQWRLRESPEYGTKYQLYTHEDQVEEYNEEALARKVSEAKNLLSAVKNIETRSLNMQDSISVKLLQSLLEGYIKGYKYRVHGAYNPVSFLYDIVGEYEEILDRMKFDNLEDYNNWLSRLQLLPKSVDEHIKLMEIAISQNMTLSNYSMIGVLQHFDDTLGKELTELTFYKPFKNIPDNISQSSRDDLIQQAESVLRDNMIPAIQKLRGFVANSYIPNTRPEIGASSLPNGAEFYQACLDWHLSTSMTPQEIHNIGLAEVERIQGLMEKIKNDTGFTGNLKEYMAHLKSKPENFYQSEEEMVEGYKSLVQKIKAKMPTAFETITKIELRVEGYSTKFGMTAFHVDPSADGKSPGVFRVNVYDPASRPKFNMMSLTMHEAFPGHHQQAGYTIEQGLPDFRRLTEFRKIYAVPFNWQFFTAYTEGWGLYAEKLGEAEDMDLYMDRNSLSVKNHPA